MIGQKKKTENNRSEGKVNNQIKTCREQRQAGKTSGDGCFSACLFYHIELQEEKVCMM